MILKLSWLRLFVNMFYGVALLAAVGSFLLAVITRQGGALVYLIWAGALGFNALVLDVICSIGEKLVRLESEQNFLRAWIQQVSDRIK